MLSLDVEMLAPSSDTRIAQRHVQIALFYINIQMFVLL